MAKSDLKIKTTSPQGANMTTTIAYVNPAATNAQLATLGNRINQLTSNIYGHSEKVTTVNVDGEPGGGQALPTFTLTNDEGQPITEFVTTVSTADDLEIGRLTYNGDGRISLAPPAEFHMWFTNPEESVRSIYGRPTAGYVTAGTYTVTISATETENFAPAEYTFTLIIEEG